MGGLPAVERRHIDIERGTRRADETRGGMDTMSRVKRLLVPTDFSPTSDIAFNYALDMAAREGASIRLLHVIEDASFAAAYPDGLFVELPGLREKLIDQARKRLDDAVKACAAMQVAATTQVLVGPPASRITGEANDCGTDLIVMGTHGRTGFAHLMLGSVAERVLRSAQCPVLTVRDSSRAADIIAADAVSRRQAVGA
jgi:universal stress protein A